MIVPRTWALVLAAVTSLTVITACASDTGPDETAAAPASAGVHSGHQAAGAAPQLPLRAGERFVNLGMPESYTPSAPSGGTDEYRCIIVDPHLTKPAFLTGAQFQPRNIPIVHHAIVFAVGPGSAAAAHAKDKEAPGEGWTCFGGNGLADEQDSAWVDTWTPGGSETLLDQDAGFRLEPGSLMILQIHYNLLTDKGSDQSTVRLRLTDGTANTKRLVTWPVQAPTELPCAAGESGPLCDRAASLADVGRRFGADVGTLEERMIDMCSNGKPVPGNTQHCDIPVPRPATVYAGFGHMHLLGRSIKVELNPGTPKARTLIDVPEFNFDDQRLRPLATPVDVNPGDKLRVTCTHDASLRRQLPQLKTLPPRYVVWGDGTSDEMCLGLLTVSFRG
ncbi:monooxygenase [Actinoplanes sp. NPDC049265]|uniref:monooxygenase n=1 Tax=Actinoplanes sp. NPDC049265 TaxID=3363902 RepID=UPI00370FB95F